MLATPVVFLIFNRPLITAKVFDAIAAARPQQLLVIADGPRPGKPEDVELCEQARSIIHRIDWPCRVLTKFSDRNLGCGRCVAGGLDWAFSICDRAIILEDDCLPSADFFSFCQQLLERYVDEDRIAHIGGDDFHGSAIGMPDSYYFTRFPHVWGWATWRRAWKEYDFEMKSWRQHRDDGTFAAMFSDPAERAFWRDAFDRIVDGKLDTWDVQWSYSLLTRGRLAINPAKNLVSNLGFGNDATHTRGSSWMSALPTHTLGELRHPQTIVAHRAADERTFDVVFDGDRFRRKFLSINPSH